VTEQPTQNKNASSISHSPPSKKNNMSITVSPAPNTTTHSKPIEATHANEKPKVFRTQRYLRALDEVEQMPPEEQDLELADLKFKTSVLSNVLGNVLPASRTSRYQRQEAEVQEMSPEEQQLELAGLKFQLSVIHDAIDSRKRG